MCCSEQTTTKCRSRGDGEGKEGGRETVRERIREGGREGESQEGREGENQGGREGGREEGERQGENLDPYIHQNQQRSAECNSYSKWRTVCGARLPQVTSQQMEDMHIPTTDWLHYIRIMHWDVHNLSNYLWDLECDLNGLCGPIDGTVANSDRENGADNAAVSITVLLHCTRKESCLADD